MKLKRRVFVNKKTGQASITLPKKLIQREFKRMPKEIIFDLKKVKKGKW